MHSPYRSRRRAHTTGDGAGSDEESSESNEESEGDIDPQRRVDRQVLHVLHVVHMWCREERGGSTGRYYMYYT